MVACRGQCKLKGDWRVKNKLMFENYEQASPYTHNRIIFFDDKVELSSGFFYLTDDLIDNFPKGRFPFVYYGNKESYKISGDSLHIYNRPYKSWRSFLIECEREDEIRLVGINDTLILIKEHIEVKNRSCTIKQIKVHVDGGGNDLFQINYRVVFSNDDRLIVEEWDLVSEKFNLKEFELTRGAFKNICDGFNYVDLLSLKEFYHSEASESIGTKIEITLTNGVIIKSELRNQDYPEELRLALIPVLYTHQQLLYSHLPPVK